MPNAPGQAPQQPQIAKQAPEKHSNKSAMAWLLKHYAGLVGVARAAEKVMAVCSGFTWPASLLFRKTADAGLRYVGNF